MLLSQFFSRCLQSAGCVLLIILSCTFFLKYKRQMWCTSLSIPLTKPISLNWLVLFSSLAANPPHIPTIQCYSLLFMREPFNTETSEQPPSEEAVSSVVFNNWEFCAEAQKICTTDFYFASKMRCSTLTLKLWYVVPDCNGLKQGQTCFINPNMRKSAVTIDVCQWIMKKTLFRS